MGIGTGWRVGRGRYNDGMLRRLRRILFHSAAAGSALLLVAVLILWPRSYFRRDTIHFNPGTGRCYVIQAGGGRFEAVAMTSEAFPKGFEYFRGQFSFGDGWQSWSYGDHSPTVADKFHTHKFLGCVCSAAFPNSSIYPADFVVIPDSYLAIVSAIMPAIWLATRKRRRRKDRLAHGLCLKCGYDLRAHKPGDNCPECGTAITSVAEAKV